MKKGLVKIDPQRCKGCYLCVRACPFQVLSSEGPINAEGTQTVAIVKPDACTACSSCYLMCPDLAITVYSLEEKNS